VVKGRRGRIENKGGEGGLAGALGGLGGWWGKGLFELQGTQTQVMPETGRERK